MKLLSHKVGMGLRPPHFTYLEQKPATEVAWLEARTEDYLNSRGRPLDVLNRLRQDYPLALHGSSLNIGSPEGPHLDYLQRLRDLIERVEPFIISDHLCWTGSGNENLHELLPLPFTQRSIAAVVSNIDFVQSFLRRPMVLEIVSSYISYLGNEMPEWDFVAEVSRRSGCTLLLDLNNVYFNSCNQNYDPWSFISHLPMERVAQVHLAGPSDYDEFLLGSDSPGVPDSIWDLLQIMAPQIRHLPISIEREQDQPNFHELEAEVKKTVAILERSYEFAQNTESV